MTIDEFDETVQQLFGSRLLEEQDEYGYTAVFDRDITRIGYATNLSLETVDKAIEQGVELLVTHHDAWDFIYGLREACTDKLAVHRISHFWVHAPLDFVDFGTCTSLMHVLGVDKIHQFSSYTEKEGEQPGIAEFHQPLEFSALVDRMRGQLNEPVRAWKNNDKPVKRIGVLTGAGHSSTLIRQAVIDGCDTYITGEATLYTIQYAQFAGINLLVGSHTFTEIFGVETLAHKVKQARSEVAIIRIEETHFELNH